MTHDSSGTYNRGMPAGSLTLWRWHARSCPHRAKGRRWTRSTCAVWVQGSLGGEWVKRSLNTLSWTAAAAVVHGWEAAGQIGVVKLDVPTIEQAMTAYFDDATARHLAETTLRKRRELLEGKLLPFCRAQGISLLKQLNVTTLRTFRNGWPYSALSAVKRLEGVSLESVSKLLGHTSIKVTERHYAPWVKARQDQLEIDVRRTWAS